ncbi:MAG: (d)CMP kinase [Phycisphaerae bacterium]
MIITIDGPAGSGKSTAARRLAKKLEIAFLDTGATYRAVTLKALGEGTDLHDPQAMASIAREAHITMMPEGEEVRVLLDNHDVSEEIRSARITEHTRYAATYPEVREVLVELQRKLGRQLGEFVTEGRDQGSVVFPDADVKFYLDASPEVRAQRRLDEMHERGEDEQFEAVLEAIKERDHRDMTREVGPLRQADDAIVVDTSQKNIDEVVAELLRLVREKS